MKKFFKIILTVIYLLLIILYLNPKEIFDFFWYVDSYSYIYGVSIILSLASIFLIYKTFSLILEGIREKKTKKIILGFLIVAIFTLLFVYIHHIEKTGCLAFDDCWAPPPSTNTTTPCVPSSETPNC